LSKGSPASPEVTRFLREHPPFDALEEGAVERVAATVEVEFHRAGTTIFYEGAQPVAHLRVVRSGAVEIVHSGRILDLLGEGELFGHASMLSGLPPGFQARAAEDTLCYRIDADVAEALLAAPAGLRFVARSLLETTAEIDRGAPVLCPPHTSIREAARMMTAASATSLVIDGANGTLGILTDRDLRTRVVANGLSVDAPVSAAMSAPAYTCRPDRLGGEALLDMLDRGFRHLPVVSAHGEVLGVVEDLDLVAVYTRSSFFLRQRIARAESVAELALAAAELRPTVIAMHEARVAAVNVMAVYAVVVDALTRRLLELTLREAGTPSARFAWLALGSQARREPAPSSDIDSALVWFGDHPETEVRPQLHEIGKTVVAGLEQCGFRADAHGATASDLLFVRSVESWQKAVKSWIADPTQEKALLLASVLVDSRPVWGVHTGTPVSDTFRLAPENPALLRLMARFALSHKPPTGFFRGLVVDHTGEHRGRLDLKHGGVMPIADLARWAALAAGVTTGSTGERLRAAAAAGKLKDSDARTLEEAFELIASLRLTHQVNQLRSGQEPDDYIAPDALSALTRSHLREAFRSVAAVQKRVSAELDVAAW
jgi:CBS domain-containing protein